MRRFVEAGQFEQAWRAAQAQPQLVGDVHFDFLYGVAAVNVGRVAEGLLALERHLAAVPANDRARLELARGYFLLGEYARARSEFEFVLRYNPPAGVRANIAGFLQAMQVREATDRRATARVYAELGAGRDNNVNGGTFRDELQLVFGNVSLVGSPSQQVADDFAQLALGGQQVLRVSNRLSVFGGVDLDHRANREQSLYDQTNGAVNIGFTNLAGQALWRATLAASQLRVGGDRYRDLLSLGVDANWSPGPDSSLMAFVQYGEQRHAAAEEVRDGRGTTLGAMFTRSFGGVASAPSVGLRLSWTQEKNLRLRRDLDREMPLLRLFASFAPAERLRIAVGLTAWQQRYGAADIGFGSVRRDTGSSVDLVASLAIDERWSLRAEAATWRNRSNQDLYDSNRRAASLKLRYQF